jgi:hypothetical protein
MEIKSGRARNQDMGAAPASYADLQRLWFATARKPWTSLAIVPAESGLPADEVAEALVAVGRRHGARSVRSLSAVGAGPGDVQTVIESVRAMTGQGDYVVIAVDPIAQNPAAMPIVGATSGVLMVVRLGATRLSSARNLVRAVGPERLLGGIVLG